jgi:hypothetical protein
VGTSGHVLPFLDGANTWSGAQAFSAGLSGNLNGNVSGSSGSCTGNAATASYAGSAGSAASVSGAAVRAGLGYTPANQGGDTFGGPINFNGGDAGIEFDAPSTVILWFSRR